MAIKINGTTVINDSRQLSNITNLRTINGQSILGTGNIEVGGNISPTRTLWPKNTALQTFQSPQFNDDELGNLNNLFGRSVSIDGNYAIISAPRESASQPSSRTRSGRVYIYKIIDSTNSVLLHTLNNPNIESTAQLDEFGWSVAIHGRFAVVGCPNETSNGVFAGGVVYVYDVITGSLIHTIKNPNNSNDAFGSYVAIHNNRIAVGAPSFTPLVTSYSGVVYIFDTTTGGLLRRIDNPNLNGDANNDAFGSSIALTSNHVIVGSPTEEGTFIGGTDAGKVYVFDINTGTLLYNLNGSNAGDYFGYSVDAIETEGETDPLIIVGAPYSDVGFTTRDGQGRAYIFRGNTLLTNVYSYAPNDTGGFGASVAISEKYYMIAASFGGSPRVYIFEQSSGAYVFYSASGTAATNFGIGSPGISVSGNYILIGDSQKTYTILSKQGLGNAYLVASNTVYDVVNTEEIKFTNARTLSCRHPIFENSEAPYELVKTFKNPNAFSTPDTDQFGFSVSTDGNYTIIGSRKEDQTSGTNAGKAYIFENISGQLFRVFDNPNNSSTPGFDEFGYSVSVYGNYALVGAPYEDTGTSDAGVAYLFEINTGRRVRTFVDPIASSSGIFGASVVLNGTYAIIGCPNGTVSGSAAGKVYVFNLRTGTLLHTLVNPEPSPTDRFGFSVAASSNFIVIGAYTDDTAVTDVGKAYVYDVNTGTRLYTLTSPNPNSSGFFGYSVAINNRYCVIGAPGETIGADTQAGRAYIYDLYINGNLIYTLENPSRSDFGGYGTATSDLYGHSVALSDDYVAVGAPQEDTASYGQVGRVYAYYLKHEIPMSLVPSSGAPFTIHELNSLGSITNLQTGSVADTFFGGSIALSKDNYLIVGADSTNEITANGSDSGRAYLFSLNSKSYLDKAAII